MADTTFYNRGDVYHDCAGNPAIIKRGNQLTFTEHFNAGGGGDLAPATANTLGGVKVGNGLNVASDGTLSVAGANYSTIEQLTGRKDIDGKDIYERTFTNVQLTNNGTTEVEILSDIYSIKKMYGIAEHNTELDGINARPLPFAGSSSNDIRLDITSNKLRVVTFSDWSSYVATITIEYTKPTPAETTNNRTVKKSTSKKG